MNDAECMAELKQLTVLYVEDEESIRSEVAHFLTRRVGHLLTATNGEEGLQMFRDLHPDMVLTDIQMPLRNGIAMAEQIKQLDRDTPVIFTTVFEEPTYLLQAVELGADGYIVKPIILDKLLKTILRCVRLLLQSREIATSRARLAAYHEATENERQLIADLMARMMRPENLRDHQVRYWLRPAEVVGGDLIAVARSRNNKLHVMLADSTGHGLPAALNLLPINHIFYRMVSKGLPISLMVEEMNWAVRDQSPTERYVAALVACIDVRNRMIEVWNGGLPGAFYMDHSGHIARRFESNNFPLGILDRTFTAETDIYQWSEHGHLVIYSDGLEDAENEEGKAFGQENIESCLREAEPNQRFDSLCQAGEAHLNTRNAPDDITLLLVASNPPATP